MGQQTPYEQAVPSLAPSTIALKSAGAANLIGVVLNPGPRAIYRAVQRMSNEGEFKSAEHAA